MPLLFHFGFYYLDCVCWCLLVVAFCLLCLEKGVYLAVVVLLCCFVGCLLFFLFSVLDALGFRWLGV